MIVLVAVKPPLFIGAEWRIYVLAAYDIIGSDSGLSPVCFGAKPLYEPMLEYCQLDLWEQFSVKF